jgi:UDP-GlcNAc:undecaprenyl-phosphate/decaprenyl-phosphate GlcNAc-1-phosphate transferase
MSWQLWLAPAALAFLAGFACTLVLSRSRVTMLMGGFAILAAVAGALWGTGILSQVRYLLLAMGLLFAAGLWSDVSDRGDSANLAVQVLATALIVGMADLRLLAMPVTVFVLLAVAHVVSMMDGLRGFRAVFAFVALAWFTAAAAMSGLQVQFQVGLVLTGAIGGYLVSLLVLLKRPSAQVLLGSAGGLMIGFALGWLAIDLTVGKGREFPVVAAVWVLMLPLANALSVALRRKALRRNLFERDGQQIHHYLFAIGCSQAAALWILAGASTLLGAIGFAGWLLRVPELVMWVLAAAAFASYHAWMTRTWRRMTGFTVVMT